MRFIAVGVFLVVVCGIGQAARIDRQAVSIDVQAANNDGQILAAPPESSDIIANKKRLFEELVSNLCKSAQQAADAMTIFASGLKDQVRIVKEKVHAEIQKLRDRVTQTIANIGDRMSSASGAMKECVESQKKRADQLLNDAAYGTMTCADEKVQEISNLIARQVDIAQSGLEFASNAKEAMRNCTDNDNYKIIKGACIGMIALKTEMKGAVFMTQSGINVARVDIAIAKLPVALELCAGQRLLEAGMSTAKVILDLQKCKVSNAFSAITGSELPVPNADVDPSFGNEDPIQISDKLNENNQ